jgi:hypothetical protein
MEVKYNISELIELVKIVMKGKFTDLVIILQRRQISNKEDNFTSQEARKRRTNQIPRPEKEGKNIDF